MMNIPKILWISFKKCAKHQPRKVTWYKKDKDSLFTLGKQQGAYDRKHNDCGGQTKLVCKKAESTNIVLTLEPTYRSKRILATKRCKHFELGRDMEKGF
ncbi:60S ribosomal protein L36a [Manis javanica]|nr:60S ribosomal protein L36a-like [Manis javanica]KAI5947405.1 60S ribosomal protein L36a [Manis javanica]